MRIEELNAQGIRDNAERLAALMRNSWSDLDGRCYYPYKPFTSADGWRNEIAPDVERGVVRSWVMIHDGQIVGHAGLFKIWNGLWESGRWVVCPKFRGHGINTKLVNRTLVAAAPTPVIIGCSYYAGLSQKTSLHHGCVPVGLLPSKFNEHGSIWGEVVMLKLAWPTQLILPHSAHDGVKRLARQAAAFSGGQIKLVESPARDMHHVLLEKWQGDSCCLMEDLVYQRGLLAAGKAPAAILPCSVGWKIIFSSEPRPPIIQHVTGQLTADLGIVSIHSPPRIIEFLSDI